MTPVNDAGADVVVLGEPCSLVQCKHTRKSGKYDEYEPILQIDSAKNYYENRIGKTVGRKIVISNATGFSRRVRARAKEYKIGLYSLKDLKKLLDKYRITPSQVQERLLAPKLFEN